MSDSKPQAATTARTAPLPTYYQSPTGNIYPKTPLPPSCHPAHPQNTPSLQPIHSQPTQITQMKSKPSTVAFTDDTDIFPPLDFRKCTRCSKNDASAPGFCVYQTTCADTDSIGMVVLRNRERVAQQHVYCRDKEECDGEEGQGDFVCIKKEPKGTAQTQQKDACVQTVIGLAEIRTMKKGKVTEYKHIDPVFLAPKEFRNTRNLVH